MSDTYGDGPASGDETPAAAPHAPDQYPPPQHAQPPYPQQPYPPAPYQQSYDQQPYGVPPAGFTPPGHYPYGQQPYGQYAPHLYGQPGFGPPGFGVRDPDARPGTVLAAGIITMVLSGMVMLFAALMLFVFVAAQTEFINGFRDETDLGGTDSDALFTGILIVLVLGLVWCAAAFVLAIFALRRSNSARITLVVSSSVTAAVSLLAITGGVSVVTLVGAIAVIVLLFTGGAGEWYRGRHDVAVAQQPY